MDAAPAPMTDNNEPTNDQASTAAPNKERSLWNQFTKHLNFYRIHLLFFTFTPLVFSVIFYLSNGETKISYVDSLFNCVSAMAVCGLATVDLSSLTHWQQVILFIQMSIGNPIIVSWFVVYSRRNFIAKNCSTVIEEYRRLKGIDLDEPPNEEPKTTSRWRRLLRSMGIRSPIGSIIVVDLKGLEEQKHHPPGIRPSMIRRMSGELQRVNPSGIVAEPQLAPARTPTPPLTPNPPIIVRQVSAISSDDHGFGKKPDPEQPADRNFTATSSGVGLPRTMTVTFQDAVRQRQPKLDDIPDQKEEFHDHLPPASPAIERIPTRLSVNRTQTVISARTNLSRAPSFHGRKNRGFGGFPTPFTIARNVFQYLFPSLDRRLERTLTVPASTHLVRTNTAQAPAGVREALYVRENTLIRVGRNSDFQDLSDEDKLEFAFNEYEALRLLLWIIAVFHIAVQLISFAIIAPYMSTSRWSDIFITPQQVKNINPIWFSAFQVVSAYTNTGMSLVDQSMLPFQSAYVLIFIMIFLILVGNTCHPIILRFIIWALSSMNSKHSRTRRTLEFLLDHPRRCYIYLFPSHQTWFLLTVVIGLTLLDWAFFLILDIGNEVLNMIPLRTRVLDGFMQAVAVRAAGFGIVPLAALAPAVKVLYTTMMYISVYPIAMSVRATNVFEAHSLGIFTAPEDEEENETNFNQQGGRVQVWGRYMAMHLRQQLAFDMWWIVLGVFIICIIEENALTDIARIEYFNIFSILFELVSAYGIVGLSLGLPTRNFSFSGDLKPLSKLVICLVILRGRHRGLPVAIDRAILFPKEYRAQNMNVFPMIRTATGHQSHRPHVAPTNPEFPDSDTTRTPKLKDRDGLESSNSSTLGGESPSMLPPTQPRYPRQQTVTLTTSPLA